MRMTSPHRSGGILAACLVAGCSGGPLNPDRPSARLDPGPHRGALRKIEGAEGFIEVVTEPVRDAPSGSPKFRVAVYFLDRGQTGSFRPEPTDVALEATWPDAPTATTIPLVAAPAAGDPAGMAKFVAPPADHRGEPAGMLRARLGERTIAATL